MNAGSRSRSASVNLRYRNIEFNNWMRYTIMVRTMRTALPLAMLLLGVVACTPTVQVAVPDKPIEINLNVKIEHEIRVKVDKELDEIFEENSDLF